MGLSLKRSQIENIEVVCPYCMSQPEKSYGCCGESSAHFESAYILSNDDCILASEVSEIIEDLCLSCGHEPKGDGQLCLKCEQYKPGES